MLALLFTLCLPALAQDEPAEAVLGEGESEIEYDGIFAAPSVGETIVVTDEEDVKRARAEVTRALDEAGYEKKRRRGDRTVYVTDVPWKAKVIVDDDGWMIMRRRGVVLSDPDLPEHWWFSDTPLEYLTCAVAPHMCVRVGGLFVSNRRLQAQKGRVVAEMSDELYDYSDALAANALYKRIYEQLPAELDGIWVEGVEPVTGRALSSPAERRAAILELWISRTDNEYGDAVRVAIEDYMSYVVQESPHPFTAAEIADANARKRCLRDLELSDTTWSGG